MGQDRQPEEHSPEPILFTDVITAGAETFLSTKADAACIQQIAEEFPARGGFKAGDSQFAGHHIDGGAGGHRPGNAG